MTRFPALDVKEFKQFKKLDTPSKVQDFLNTLRMNFELPMETFRSPLMVLRTGEAHCIEGAGLAAAILWSHGRKPLLLDLKTMKPDYDHVVALFKEGDRWGAISKTNHAVLRYRDPIYKTVRELALSYFHEYFLDRGVKTSRSYSRPFSLLPYDEEWLVSPQNLWKLQDDLDGSPHVKIIPPKENMRLRVADKIQIEAGKIVEWRPRQRKEKRR